MIIFFNLLNTDYHKLSCLIFAACSNVDFLEIPVFHFNNYNFKHEGPCGKVVNVLDRNIVVGKFKPWLLYYINFQTNTFGKGINPCYLVAKS